MIKLSCHFSDEVFLQHILGCPHSRYVFSEFSGQPAPNFQGTWDGCSCSSIYIYVCMYVLCAKGRRLSPNFHSSSRVPGEGLRHKKFGVRPEVLQFLGWDMGRFEGV